MQTDLFDAAPRRAYFNTTGAPAQTVARRNVKAQSQNDVILQFFQERTGETFTAWELSQHFENYPITSIRRSLTTLAKFDKLREVGQRPGRYGVETTIYQFKL